MVSMLFTPPRAVSNVGNLAKTILVLSMATVADANFWSCVGCYAACLIMNAGTAGGDAPPVDCRNACQNSCN